MSYLSRLIEKRLLEIDTTLASRRYTYHQARALLEQADAELRELEVERNFLQEDLENKEEKAID